MKKEAVIKNPPFPKNYSSEFLQIEKGEGSYLFDTEGNRYIDFGAGIAVNALGYGREDLARLAYDQMKQVIHVSNLYTTAPAVELAEKMIDNSTFSAVHFGNSGSEANETALKYARLYALKTKGEGHHRYLSFTCSFHGRTMGALSVTAGEKYKTPFEPLIPGVDILPYNDPESLVKKINKNYAAVIVEVVQGEGGLEYMKPEFASVLNEVCSRNDVVLIADEVQTGLGRTGFKYASESVGLIPDIITLSKPLAGGLPLSATLIPEKINNLLSVGDHGTTFGGGPVTTRIASHIWDIVTDPEFLEEVRAKGDYLSELLTQLSVKIPYLKQTKGMGLLQGVTVDLSETELKEKMPAILGAAKNEGLLILRSGSNVIRIAPPLVIQREEIEKGIQKLENALKNIGE
jgi:predicted acetylornithine/succinylornithine family transaminase